MSGVNWAARRLSAAPCAGRESQDNYLFGILKIFFGKGLDVSWSLSLYHLVMLHVYCDEAVNICITF